MNTFSVLQKTDKYLYLYDLHRFKWLIMKDRPLLNDLHKKIIYSMIDFLKTSQANELLSDNLTINDIMASINESLNKNSILKDKYNIIYNAVDKFINNGIQNYNKEFHNI